MNIYNYILWRIRNFGSRFSANFGNQYRVLYSGTIVKMGYSNYKHDPNPLCLILYSGVKYTHALNLNYLSISEKQYIARLIYALKTGRQVIDGHYLYLLLKRDVYYSIVRKCYRTYFSNLIMQPRMVSAGWTPMTRLVIPYSDQYIVWLNRYLGSNYVNNPSNRVSYYPEELQDRISMAINSVPVGRGSISATTPATTPATVSATSTNIGN